jgi:phage tail-like protein
MPGETNQTSSGNNWPLVKFSFAVQMGNDTFYFQEVSGLETETEVIEYRAGNSPVFSTVKMPGLKKMGNVTLKKGLFENDRVLWELHKQMTTNTFKRTTITISLLDENKTVAMSWKLQNAFPVKMTVTDMKGDNNGAAVETMELAHEGLSIA